ncbi:hypothetical protein B0H11DRAFT_1822516 [Mycena galericulata]|nr:hypothetical protein B0H11DRAFT_1822516 [Mycena galericulata]
MVAAIPLVSVNLATVSVESCFYGTFLVLSMTSLLLLVGRSRGPSNPGHKGKAVFNSPIFLGAVSLFITVTSHWIITVDRSFLAFIPENGTSPLEFYGDLSQTTEVVKSGFLFATVVIGDVLIIHRLWIIWGYNKTVIIFPICTLVALSVGSVGTTYEFTQYKLGQTVFLSETDKWITSTSLFTVCTNIYCTGLIAWKIWRSSQVIIPYGGKNLKSLIAIIIESAALYASWAIFFIVAYHLDSNVQFLVVDCLPSITGISCMLIHVRVGLGWAETGIHNSSVAPSTAIRFASSMTDAGLQNDEYQLEERGKAEVV